MRKDGEGWEVAIHGVLVDRLLALAAMLAIVVLGWPLLSPLLDAQARLAVGALLASSAAGLALLTLADQLRLERLWRGLERVTRVAASCRAVCLSREAPKSLLVAVAVHVALSYVVWLLANGLGLHLPLLTVLVLVPLVLMISMIPVSVAGWGVREGAMVVAFGLLGVPPARAFALSVLFGTLLLVAGFPGGVLWLRGGSRTGR
jgi:uncharacterized membrane protein YbhN (UPF0104 family)